MHPKDRYWLAPELRASVPRVSLKTAANPAVARVPAPVPGSVVARLELPAALAHLRVWHRAGGGSAIVSWDARPGLQVHTCQRSLHVCVELPGSAERTQDDADVLRGQQAYEFLLQFATGLKSAVAGETNVFGQLLAAWRAHANRADEAQTLAPVLDRLIRDAREIRARYLQGIGGQSYATLARRLLAPGPGARVLVAGYGELGRSMPGKFSRTDLAVFNRTPPASLPAEALRYFAADEARAAAAWATHVVFCLPRDADIDATWTGALRDRPEVRVVHLGLRRGARGPWNTLSNVHDLDDLFDLQRSQAQRRSAQLEQAQAACATFAARAVSPAVH